MSTVAALVGMIPEGLYLLTSVALAVGVIRWPGGIPLIHGSSAALRPLPRWNLLCVGTIRNLMKAVTPLGRAAPGRDRLPIGAYYRKIEEVERALQKAFGRALKMGAADRRAAVLLLARTCDAEPDPGKPSGWMLTRWFPAGGLWPSQPNPWACQKRGVVKVISPAIRPWTLLTAGGTSPGGH